MSTSNWSSVNSLTTKAGYVPAVEETTLTAQDNLASDYFGWSIAVDNTGTRVVVGQINGDGSVSNSGKAIVFIRSGSTWSREATLSSSNETAGGQFGVAVDIDSAGTRIIVGANYEAPGGATQGGRAYIFSRSGSTWIQEKTLMASDSGITYERYGNSVAIDDSGTRCVVGASQGDSAGQLNIGKIYIYTRSGSTWTQSAILAMGSRQPSDKCQTTAISGDGSRAFYSSVYRDYITTDTGVVGVFA